MPLNKNKKNEVQEVSFLNLAEEQYNLVRTEVGSVQKWDESFSRLYDSYDAFVSISSIGRPDYSVSVALANLYAEVKRSYVDHKIQDNKPLDTLVEAEVKRLGKDNRVSSLGELRGKVILSFGRLHNHLMLGSLGGTVKPLLVGLAATILSSAEDLGLPTVEEKTEPEKVEHTETAVKRQKRNAS